jgi:hypothetical protein
VRIFRIKRRNIQLACAGKSLTENLLDVLIVGECWRDREKKNEQRFFHLNALPRLTRSVEGSLSHDDVIAHKD